MTVDTLYRPVKSIFISTYPPRRCGIATFTADLVSSMKRLYNSGENVGEQNALQVMALHNREETFDYSGEVVFQIEQQHRDDYSLAADYINLSPVDIVCLQHEFGIFGGEDGDYILHLIYNLRKPLVTTLHTILEEPSKGQKRTLARICRHSSVVVVQANRAVQMLHEIYGVPKEKIAMIHHGTPDVPFLDPFYYKNQFQAEGRKVLLTFGLLGPSKGIEYAIEAMEAVVRECPEALYMVLGATHSEIIKHHGEQYRRFLENMVREKNLSEHVVFYNQYIATEKLLQFLLAADIYVTPYTGREQIVSGTLAYALACGKAIISTPYRYAEELLDEGRGVLVPFADSRSMAAAIIKYLKDENLRNRVRKAAYQFGRQMIWPEAAKKYTQVFEQALLNYGNSFAAVYHAGVDLPKHNVLPEINLRHFKGLTDDTGLFQHAVYNVPDRRHGYCTDDNARALIVSAMNWRLQKDKGIIPYLQKYLSFIHNALDEQSGRFRNFLAFDRRWLEKQGSEDSHGRALWALGYTVAHPPDDPTLALCTRLFKRASAACSKLLSPRAKAFSILGCLYYLKRFPGDTAVSQLALELSRRLLDSYRQNAEKGWSWFENMVTYDNARLSQSLIAAGKYFDEREMLEAGLESLEWLIAIQTDQAEGHLSLVGNQGWYRRGERKARFDQQPLEAAALIDGCYQALLATGLSSWRRSMDWVFNWFFGENDVGLPLYDYGSGGCFDGLQPGGINLNQGGESTVSFLLALHRMHLLYNADAVFAGARREEVSVGYKK